SAVASQGERSCGEHLNHGTIGTDDRADRAWRESSPNCFCARPIQRNRGHDIRDVRTCGRFDFFQVTTIGYDAGMKRVLVATSNAGKLRDLTGAALPFKIEFVPLLELADLPPVIEDGATFEAKVRKKAEAYSRYASSE